MLRRHLTRTRLGLVLAIAAGVLLGAVFGQPGNGRAASEAVPKNKTLPTISGAALVGQTLVATHGTWSGSPTSFHYAWSRCDTTGAACLAISGATGKIYTVTASDVGHTLRVTEGLSLMRSVWPILAPAHRARRTRSAKSTCDPRPAPTRSRRPAERRMSIPARIEYSLRALAGLAEAHPVAVNARTLAQTQHIPAGYVYNVLADLRRADLVYALRGNNGGYALTRPAEQITLGTVLLNGLLWTWLSTSIALRGNLLRALRNE